MAFNANVNGHSIMLDADEAAGGMDKGARPKALLLAGLAGCTGIDVVSILNKMKVELADLIISVEANLTEEHPKVYNQIKIIYHFKGNDLSLEKLNKAVNLSLEKYCGVTAMLAKSAVVTHEIIISK